MVAAVERTAQVVVSAAPESDAIVLDGVVRTMLTPSEVARLWHLPVKTVYRLIREGRLPVLNLAPGARGGAGDRYRISYRAVRQLEASQDAPIPSGD